VGRRFLAGLVFVVAFLAIGGGVLAQLETAPPTVAPEFVTPVPTVAPVITPVASFRPVTTPLATLPTVDVAGAAAFGFFSFLFAIAVGAFFVIVLWRIFTKAGEPGWAAIVPIYNWIVLLKIVHRPWWWIFIMWLIIPAIIVYLDLAKVFGQSTAFGVGLILLPVVFLPILAFGGAQYQHGGVQPEPSGFQ
jgi:hypothetical protein